MALSLMAKFAHMLCLFSYYVISVFPEVQPGAVARSEASSLGMQAAPSSIPMSGTFFRGDLVMKIPLPLIQKEQLSVTGERMCTKYW